MESVRHDIVLVDADDVETGTGAKLAVHYQGALHRAFSVMIWDGAGRLLLQKRHAGKYHSGGLWTNACCGHPGPGEDVRDSATRRLAEEMGFGTQLEPLGTIRYRAVVGSGMIEHELVHVFRGIHHGPVRPNPVEAEGYAWVAPGDLRQEMTATPQRFSAWLREYMAAGWPLTPPAMSGEVPSA